MSVKCNRATSKAPSAVFTHPVKHAPDGRARLVDRCNHHVAVVPCHALQVTHHSQSSKAVQATGWLIKEDNAGGSQDTCSIKLISQAMNSVDKMPKRLQTTGGESRSTSRLKRGVHV
jgi:hypothetical protein